MFKILLSLLIIFPVLMGFGEIFQKLFGRIWSGLSAKLFSGMFLLAIIWQVLAFFVPLNIWIESISILIGGLSFLYFRSCKDFLNYRKEEIVKFSILSLIIIFAGTYYPFIIDHFGYYVPSIHWLREFGLTKGLANIEFIYAQMSVWHIFQAGFSNFSDVFLRINVIFLLVFLLYILEKKAWEMLFILPIFLFFIQSPNSDLPAIALSLVILNEVMNGNKNVKLLFAFSAFIFTIKPTIVWVLLFVAIYFFKKENFKYAGLGIVVLGIYIFKNILVFGYPFFPIQIGDLKLYWMPHREVLKESAELAIMKAYDLKFSILEIEKFTVWDYVYNWFTINSYKKYIHFAFVLVMLLFVVFTFIKKDRLTTALFASIVIKSFLVLMFSAQYRFFMGVFFVFFLINFKSTIKEKISYIGFSLKIFLIIISLSFPKLLQNNFISFKSGYYMQGFTQKQIYRPASFASFKYSEFKIGNLKFYIPHHHLAYDTPHPSIAPYSVKKYYEAGIFPQKISKNIKDGFVWKKLSTKDKEKLKGIISKF